MLDCFARAAADGGMPLKVVSDSRAGGRERYEAAYVLVRPDQFVAWASDAEPADAAAILDRTTGRAGLRNSALSRNVTAA